MSIHGCGNKVFEIWDEMLTGIWINTSLLNKETFLLMIGSASNFVRRASTALIDDNEENTSIIGASHVLIGPSAIWIIA